MSYAPATVGAVPIVAVDSVAGSVTRSAARSRAPPVTNQDRISTSVVVTSGPATTSSSALQVDASLSMGPARLNSPAVGLTALEPAQAPIAFSL